MKVYLVGGAIRDKLLRLPIQERDWVVVGATEEDMLQQCFTQVGRSFPVFIHPETKEEYALARKERKKGFGYYGFECDFSPDVSLEEDLLRRDLTINAMAEDQNGDIIDPYDGRKDIEKKLLRHVSPAFVEDPVRVLRIARFAARFHSIGFRLAPETRRLMYDMVCRGELNHLVPERVWQEWYKSLQFDRPEQFILTLRSCGALKAILPEIHALFGAPASYHYHPEVDSGVHTLMSLRQAVSLSSDPVLRFGVLVHDVGKAVTDKARWPKQTGHDVLGVPVIQALCERLRVPVEFRRFAELVSEHHINIHRCLELKPETMVRIIESADAIRKPERFAQLLLACKADSLGRLGADVDYVQEKHWQAVLSICQSVQVKAIVASGLKGEAIKQELHRQRVALVKQYMETL